MPILTQWTENANLDATEQIYDSSTVVYDSSTVTYDSIDLALETPTLTEWSNIT